MMTSLRKCFPLSLTSSNGCPNRIMISSKKKSGSRQGVIPHGGSSFYPLGGIIRCQNDVLSFPGIDRIDRSDKVNSPLLERSKWHNWGERPMVPERGRSCSLALVTFSDVSLDISDQAWPPISNIPDLVDSGDSSKMSS